MVSVLKAHRNPVKMLSFNREGTMLATASEQVSHCGAPCNATSHAPVPA
jgi:hypothetical protein